MATVQVRYIVDDVDAAIAFYAEQLVSRSINNLNMSSLGAMLGSSLAEEVTRDDRPTQGSTCPG